MDWHEVDASPLYETIREQAPPPDAERMVWALEQVLAGAKVDPALLDHLAVAAVCALAYRDVDTPRTVLEKLFRRAIDDARWHSDYASLLSAPTWRCRTANARAGGGDRAPRQRW